MISFSDNQAPIKKIIASVKDGAHVARTMLADLKNTVDREQASIELFVTLTLPTKPMKMEAVSAGHFQSANFGTFDQLQILTIQGLLNDTEAPRCPDLSRGSTGSRRARVEEVQGEQGELL